ARFLSPRASSTPSTSAKTPPPVSPAAEAPSASSLEPAAKQVVTDETHVAGSVEAAPSPAHTQLVQWFGMLHCTSGALAEQRFIVPEAGLWIGRDSTLSQVVIDDQRISKRHVRIVPRGGHVHAIDTESRNGTFIDKTGERIADVELKRGNTIILGDNVAAFVYEI